MRLYIESPIFRIWHRQTAMVQMNVEAKRVGIIMNAAAARGFGPEHLPHRFSTASMFSKAFQFPTELEQTIFELVAFSDPKTAVCLLRVSRTVHKWISAAIYHTVSHYPSQPLVSERYPDFAWYQSYGKFIRHLLLSLASDPILSYLKCCPDLEDIAIWGYPSDMDHVLQCIAELKAQSALPLTKLSINLKRLFAASHRDAIANHLTTSSSSASDDNQAPELPPPFRFSLTFGQHPLFQHLTHLELLNKCDNWETWSGLGSIPNLTHLTLSKWTARGFVVGALTHCHRLRVLILVEPLTVDEVDDKDNGRACRLMDEHVAQVKRCRLDERGERNGVDVDIGG
ncbi:hypothetical protein BDN72DRAFT_964932 [Pluteus cervinus]|uniref:Uncharacterized protein n=1 Tax=Pluteus cervinus TaxID=181527 RepID=A0ACD3A806_9AGAR|nr:hypothetical protein BDN72DRAFT_964932 [Pluteus cervinus]